MTTCTEHRLIVDEVGDLDRLPPATSRHVDGCAECARFGRELVALRTLLREPERVAPPSDFDTRVAAIVREHKAPPAGTLAWAARYSRPLATAACLAVAVTLTLALRPDQNAALEPDPGAVTTLALPTPEAPAPAPPSPEVVADARMAPVPASAARARRPERPAREQREAADPEVRIYIQDAEGARVVSFDPVLHGAQEILPPVVAVTGRSDTSLAVSSF
jgi:hypothetical protein